MGDAVLPDGKTADEVMADLDVDGSDMVEYNEFEAYLLREHARIGQQRAEKERPSEAALSKDWMMASAHSAEAAIESKAGAESMSDKVPVTLTPQQAKLRKG